MAALTLDSVRVENPARPGDPVCEIDGVAATPGQIVAVAGETGYGGTLLAQVLAGARRPADGRILLYGADITGIDQPARPVALIPSGGGLLPQLSLRDNIAFGTRLRYGRPDRERAAQWLARLGLVDCANRVPDWTTARQRLLAALARAMLNDPDVLVIDATGGPDPDVAYRGMVEALRRAPVLRRTTVLVMTTRPDLLDACDVVAVVADGRVADQGRAGELRDRCTGYTAPTLFGDPLLLADDLILTPDDIAAIDLVPPDAAPAGIVADVRGEPDARRFQPIAPPESPEAAWLLRLPPGDAIPPGARIVLTRDAP